MNKSNDIKKDFQDTDEISGLSNQILEFGYLINTILDYYTDGKPPIDNGDNWKKGTEHEEKIIPEEIDKLVLQAFKKQLSKFV